MGYVGSHIWRIRQGVGDMRLLTPSVDVICVNEKGELLMVHNRDFDSWSFPAGQVEEGQSWAEGAVQELQEEGGIVARPEDLIPFATISGGGYVWQYSDGSTQAFSICFIADKFEKSNFDLDTEEISEVRWVNIEEAKSLNKTLSAVNILPAYEKYLATGEFQQIVVK